MPALLVLLLLWGGDLAGADEEPGAPGGPVRKNRLAKERSPYLRQHATNPVDWYPWGEEALARARREQKPIFLSVGYAACHWCHVMEHESFEDEATAALLNDAYVCVKVDREERPDIDALYMTAVQVTSGRGGWPMTVLLTPEGEPFWAGTYLRREQLQQLVQLASRQWEADPERIRQEAGRIAEVVRNVADGREFPPFEGDDRALLRILEGALVATHDARYGGYGSRPKFPPHSELLFLLDRGGANASEAGHEQVRRTLVAMDEGGLHDHVGGGFHRYSTDERWFLPHFEKMLYDNALLAQAYAAMFQLTGEPRFARVVRDIFAWVRRDMARPAGGYASSLDADTEGEEGLTYTWTVEEIRAALGADDAAFAIALFGVTPQGNFHDEATGRRTGRSHLYLPVPLAQVAREHGVALDALQSRVDRIRERLLEVRRGRPQPGLDDKVITAWNGLLLSAFARAGAALSDDELLAEGRRLADFLLEACRREDGTLLRFPRGSGPEIVGFCDDHVHVGEGLLDLAEATGEVRYADAARALADALLADFEDRPAGGFWSTSESGHERLLARMKEATDTPIPSDNGAAAHLLLRLAARTGEVRYREAADRALGAWRPLMGQARSANFTAALHRALALRLALAEAGVGSPPPGDASAAAEPIRMDVFVERQQVALGGRVRIAVRVALAAGWHVNAARPSSEDLIPTQLTTPSEAPATLDAVLYPPAVLRSLADGAEPVALYEGTFWIRGELRVPGDVPRGPRKVPVVLRYQPCNEANCLEPRELRVDLHLRYHAEDGPARHASVFAE
ncbi:MAG: thioredoxin domain-containing protein [Planctomycetota bacterium]